MLVNDLSTRAHVADMLNHADDIQEYTDWRDSLEEMPEVDVPESEQHAGFDLRDVQSLADKFNMSVEEYLQFVERRRDSILMLVRQSDRDIQFS